MADADVRWTVEVNNLPRIRKSMATNAARIVAKAALDIEAIAKTRAPVDTGNLANSIRARKISDTRWRVEVGAEYGLYVEYGTVRSGPRPYFMPAVDRVLPQFHKAWQGILDA